MNTATRRALIMLCQRGSATVYNGRTAVVEGRLWINVNTAKALEMHGYLRQVEATRAEVVPTELALA